MEIHQPRRHDLDCLRLIAIMILLFYHTGMLFNTWGWHVKNNETSVTFNYWMVWLHYWRMPLLLFISGAGTYMALGKRSTSQFIAERFRRLFIPLVFGMLIVVPPQIYFEKINQYQGYLDFYSTVFEFVPYPRGNFSWHHLWFVLYLFLYSFLGLPLLRFLRSEKSQAMKSRLYAILSRPAGMLLLPSALLLLSQILLRPYFPDETHDLINDWAFFTFYFAFFLFGMMCYSTPGLWESIGKNRNKLLIGSVLILIPFYGAYLHIRGIVRYPFSQDVIETAFDVTAIFLSWFTVITIIAYGQHYLKRSRRWLSYVNEGLYPFYILHQTVIIGIGYYICQQQWSIAAKFWTISLLTLAGCVVFYTVFIRSNVVGRFLFGMKPFNKEV